MGRIKYSEAEFDLRPERHGDDATPREIGSRKRVDEPDTYSAGDHIAQDGVHLTLGDDAGHDARALENAIDYVSPYLVAGQCDKRDVVQVLRFYVGSFSQRMPDGHDGVIRCPAEDLRFEPCEAEWKFADSEVDALRSDRLFDPSRHVDLESNADTWMQAVELLDSGRQKAEADRRQRSYVEVAGLRFANCSGGFLDLLHGHERTFDLIEKQLRLGSRRKPARAAVEQGEIKLLFQPSNETADGRLGNAEEHGGAAHGAS